MQEFTISTPQAEDTTQPKEIQQQPVNEDITPISSAPAYKHPKTNKIQKVSYRVIFLGIITGILIIIAVIFAYLNIKHKIEDNQDVLGIEEQKEDSSDSSSVMENVPTSLKDKIFYTDSFNIYIATKDGSDQVKLTDYKKIQGIKIEEVELIDEKNLGFSRCKRTSGNYECQILTVNLETQDVKTVKEINNDLLLMQLTWANNEQYAYTVLNNNLNKLSIKYVNRQDEKEIVEIEIFETGRREFIEDDMQLKFSPNHDRIYYINTSAGTGFNFSINVYDLEGNLLDQIEDATMPVWKDNNKIIYRRYSNSETGYLYLRDVTKKHSSNLKQSAEAAYNPKALEESVLYWEATGLGKSYLYYLQRNTTILLGDSTAFPIWLSKEEIIFAKTRKCKIAECEIQNNIEFDTQFVVEEYFVHNMKSENETKINIDTRYLKRGIVTWYNRHI